MNTKKYVPIYKHVVHATEQTRRDVFQGCVSRQVLRWKLYEEAFNGIRAQYPGEARKQIKTMARAKAHRQYREGRGLK